MTAHWSRAHVAAISGAACSTAPAFDRDDLPFALHGVDLWDHWPVQHLDGRVAAIAGGTLVMFLSSLAGVDPDFRHGLARLRLMRERDGVWTDLGLLFADGFSPGSREWAGSAIIDAEGGAVTLYFTVAGVRGEAVPSFDQRMFETRATLNIADCEPQFGSWSLPVECVANDGAIYARDMTGGGGLGTIKAFRDPVFFRDPIDGSHYLLFAGSLARSASPWNGVVGIAARDGDGKWRLEPPLLDADGVNNELERPHVVVHNGLYYLFWSTQRHVFAPGPAGPNGLYGMVANSLRGLWRPLNGCGLVLANPPSAPLQAYSWLVLSDLSVLSFADTLGIDHRPLDPALARAHFGGAPAPVLQLRLRGEQAKLV